MGILGENGRPAVKLLLVVPRGVEESLDNPKIYSMKADAAEIGQLWIDMSPIEVVA
jgi:hypothetical protein